MIRNILIFILLVLVYKAVKTVVRSAVAAYNGEDRRSDAMGEEMVLDPNCKTYLPKSRATTRHINGRLTYFCSPSCARSYEERAGK